MRKSFLWISCLCIYFCFSRYGFAMNDKSTIEFQVQIGHGDEITEVAYGPNGNYVLSGSYDSTMKLWEVSTGRMVRTFRGHEDIIDSVAFGPKGSVALSGSRDNTMKLWDLKTGRALHTFIGHEKSVSSVAFSPDGKFVLSGSGDRTMKLWDASSGFLIRTFKGHEGYISCVAFSPKGDTVLSADSGWKIRAVIKLWDVSTGRLIQTIKGHDDGVKSVAFTPDGRHILSIDIFMFMRLWEVSTGRMVRETKVFSGDSVDVSPDGKYAVSGSVGIPGSGPSRWSEGMRVWDLSSGKLIYNIKDAGFGVAFSPNGKYILSGCDGNLIKLWNFKTGHLHKEFLRHSGSGQAKFSPDGHRALVRASGKILILLNALTGRSISELKSSYNNISSFIFSSKGNFILTWGAYGTMELWNGKNGNKVHSFDHVPSKGHQIVAAYISDSGTKIYTAETDPFTGNYGSLKVIEISSGRVIHSVDFKLPRGCNASRISMQFSPDGKSLLTPDKILEVPSGSVITSVDGIRNVKSGAFNKDGQFFLSVSSHTPVLWDMSSGRMIEKFTGQNNWVMSVGFTKDSKFAVSGSNGGLLKIWDIERRKEIKIIKAHDTTVTTVDISQDENLILSSSTDGTAKLWNTLNSELVCTIVPFSSGEFIIFTKEGFYSGSEYGARNFCHITRGLSTYSMDQFYDSLYRPDLVQAKLSGDPDGLVAEAASKLNLTILLAQGAAPKVSFLSPQPGISKIRDITIEASLLDQGGGIGKTVWKLNGQTIGVMEDDRGIKVTPTTSNKSITILKHITLSPEQNLIELIVYNKAGGIASDPATLFLNLKDAISEQPALHILAVGINKYRDKSLWLNYAVPDATEIVKQLQLTGIGVFKKIDKIELYDQHATLPAIAQAFAQTAKKDKTNDVFILYLAGHGITLDGRYHFLPVDFRYRNEDSVRQKAINQDHLQKWLASLDSRKSLVLLDTCNSGSFTEAQVVRRGIAEKTAIDKLTRATGRATIAASSDSQVAYEGYKGHGVFTYALLQALSQADQNYGNKDNVTTTSELASFIDELVPEITYKKWGYEQVPQVNLHGRTFPIGVVR